MTCAAIRQGSGSAGRGSHNASTPFAETSLPEIGSRNGPQPQVRAEPHRLRRQLKLRRRVDRNDDGDRDKTSLPQPSAVACLPLRPGQSWPVRVVTSNGGVCRRIFGHRAGSFYLLRMKASRSSR